jgi:two-component system OmpR family sensor kinase
VTGSVRVTRWWDALRERMPLRTQLLVAVLLLAAVTVMVTSVVAAALLRGDLLSRVDGQLLQSAERVVMEPPPRDGPGPGAGPPPPPRGFRPPADYFAQSYDDAGVLQWSAGTDVVSGLAGPDLPPMDIESVKARDGKPFTVDATSGDGSWRILALPERDSGSVAVGLPLDNLSATVGRLLVIDGIVAAVALALLAGAAWWIVRSSLRPLEQVELTAEAIAAGDLSQRVPHRDPRTEVGRLSTALNTMLGQIEAAFDARRVSEESARASEERMRRFVADASHELRTPLTSIRGFSELYRQGAVEDDAALARVMRRIEDEATRMGLLVDDLLLLARLDQQRPLETEPVDLVPLITDAVLDTRAVARGHDVRLRIDAEADSTVVRGDELRLRQVIANLVSNAVRHTPAGTVVVVGVGPGAGGGVVLEVRDDGPGLSKQDAERVFERFYRVDPSRARTSGNGATSGSGLGLSIVAALVAAHGGTVTAEPTPGGGATFRVWLPKARRELPGRDLATSRREIGSG